MKCSMREGFIVQVCVLVGVLGRICAGHWSLIGSEGSPLMKLIKKYKVMSHLKEGLEAGLRRCHQVWAGEVAMFRQEGLEGADDVVDWGGYSVCAGLGGDSYSDRRENYIMRAFGGKVGGNADDFIIVAFDGSAGEAGVGVGVVGLKVDSVNVLEEDVVGVEQYHKVSSMSRRVPEWFGDGKTGNQDAEDIGGAAAILMCLILCGVLVIGDNLQTVMDIVEIAQEGEKGAREAMRHRCMPARQMMRFVS